MTIVLYYATQRKTVNFISSNSSDTGYTIEA
jgi:hypothetical protein